MKFVWCQLFSEISFSHFDDFRNDFRTIATRHAADQEKRFLTKSILQPFARTSSFRQRVS